MTSPENILLDGRTEDQKAAITSEARRLLVVAGAGSGKTDVMARRIGWWVSERGVPKDSIVAFTFGEAAAEEMKFRIRRRINDVTPEDEDPTLEGMYVGTIHSFCIKTLRRLMPERYQNYEIIDDAARISLIQRGGAFYDLLGLEGFRRAVIEDEGKDRWGQFAAIDRFLTGYDHLNHYGGLEVELPDRSPPARPGSEEESKWCKDARMVSDLGDSDVAEAFALSAARYYAYLHARRFLDFSTSQVELANLLSADDRATERLKEAYGHLVVDECQDINEVQAGLIRVLVGDENHLTAVGDHRQAIYGWRGGRVEIMGDLHDSIAADADGEVVRLPDNFRSTPRIVDLANRWAETIGSVGGLRHPEMEHGRERRSDYDPSHVGLASFDDHPGEAEWIARQIQKLVDLDDEEDRGARHDTDDADRGLRYGDVAILVRSSTSARDYMDALEEAGIPAVFRAGPDLFSRPEVLLVVSVLAEMAGLDEFYGAPWNDSNLRNRVQDVLGAPPEPTPAIDAACRRLREQGFPLADDADDRLRLVARAVSSKLDEGSSASEEELAGLRSQRLKSFLSHEGEVRRVFPQDLFHGVLLEAGVPDWDVDRGHARSGPLRSGLFHLGQLSQLVREVESPGWTSPRDFRDQVKTLVQWGAENARTDEAPLLVPPDAVTISTVHKAKGLEFPVVFMADVRSRRFPSSYAKRGPNLPFGTDVVDPHDLADNDNYDAERRLMYVALTRAERYLFVSASGDENSRFFSTLRDEIREVGGTVFDDGEGVRNIESRPSDSSRDLDLTTSFSDLRYFLECRHDFYLRKVLGFAPGIHRAMGYGQGIHNVLRAVHEDPERWAELAENEEAMKDELERVADDEFYLRYTTGDPADEMRDKALGLVGRYIGEYAEELQRLGFDPEREFETLVEEEDVLVAGAIDLVRLEDPPRVSLLDFKSGEADSDLPVALPPSLMRLQLKIYGLAARSELEWEPERGLVRYLAEEDPERRELMVALDDEALQEAREVVADAARAIRSRRFHEGPTGYGRADAPEERCAGCDFIEICGLEPAREHRAGWDTDSS